MPKKHDETPRLRVRKGATLKEIYAACKKQFTAADLQKYTEMEPMVPMEEVLAEMERVHQEVLSEKEGKGRRKKR